MIKKYSLLLLCACIMGSLRADLFVDDQTIQVYEESLKHSLRYINDEAKKGGIVFTGTVPEFFLHMDKVGVKKIVEDHPSMVEKAYALVNEVNNPKSDDMKAVLEFMVARREAYALPKSVTGEQREQVWKRAIVAYSKAIIEVASQYAPADLALESPRIKYMLANNGKYFGPETQNLVGAVALTFVITLDQWREKLGTELFTAFAKPTSIAHEAIKVSNQ